LDFWQISLTAANHSILQLSLKAMLDNDNWWLHTDNIMQCVTPTRQVWKLA